MNLLFSAHVLLALCCFPFTLEAEAQPWPTEIADLSEHLYERAYREYLSWIKKNYSDFDLGEIALNTPALNLEQKREDWIAEFAKTTYAARLDGAKKSSRQASLGITNQALHEASQKQFLFHPQGKPTALFASMEKLAFSKRDPAFGKMPVRPWVKSIPLPSDWPHAHTMNVKAFVSSRFPEELQAFVAKFTTQLVLDNDNCQNAFLWQRLQGFGQAFAYRGNHAGTRIQTFFAVSDQVPHKFRYVVCQVRGRDDEKVYLQSLGPFFRGNALSVRHVDPAPMVEFKPGFPGKLRPKSDLVLIGFQNAVWRMLSKEQKNASWTRDFLTTNGVEVDLFSNSKTDQRIYSVRNVYGDEITLILRLFWHKGARKFLYLGSAGALDDQLQIGDLLLPSEFLENGGTWKKFGNVALSAASTRTLPARTRRNSRQGYISTLIEETKSRAEELKKQGVQGLDIESRYFATFFQNKSGMKGIALVVSDAPLRGQTLEATQGNFQAAKSMAEAAPALLQAFLGSAPNASP